MYIILHQLYSLYKFRLKIENKLKHNIIMELDKKIMSIITLCFVVAMLYMYKEVNVIKINSKCENDSIMKRIKSHDEFQSNFDSTFESKLKSLMVRSDKPDE